MAVVALLSTAAYGPRLTGAERVPARHRIEIRQLEYVPRSIDVAPGDTVIWVNLDIVPHTVSAKDASWDSGNLDTGQTWQATVTDSMAGPYICRYHPDMTATLNVVRR